MGKVLNRRNFISKSLQAGGALCTLDISAFTDLAAAGRMKFGLVTYQWGRDWDLPTLIKNCEEAGYQGVELRTGHAHKVEADLTPLERSEVRKRFAASSVKCVGYGSNFEYHSPDPAELRKNIEQTKEYIKLCHDIGATGIKVKPNDIPEGVPKEKTLEQIGRSLNEVGRFAMDWGQAVRVEVHGNHTQELPNMAAIFSYVTEPSVRISWNCNEQDLLPPGLQGNFNLVRKWIGDTVHVRELNDAGYPYRELFGILSGIGYHGWILLEARTEPSDLLAAMKEQAGYFRELTGRRK
jgi:sugar phosphate isomerase/epimerase